MDGLLYGIHHLFDLGLQALQFCLLQNLVGSALDPLVISDEERLAARNAP